MPTSPFVRNSGNTIDLNTEYNQLNTKAKTLADDLVDYVEGETSSAIGEVDTKISELLSVNPDGTYYTKDAIDLLAGAQTEDSFQAQCAQNRDRFAGSGFVHWGKNYPEGNYSKVADGLSSGSVYTNRMLIGGGSGSSKSLTEYAVVNVNGRKLNINSESNYQYVKLPQAPDGSGPADRYDLVLLEVWDELISEKDFVFPLGNVQCGFSAWNGITLGDYGTASYSRYGDWDASPTAGHGVTWSSLSKADKMAFLVDPDNNIRMTEDGLVQTRYRIRVIAGPVGGEPLIASDLFNTVEWSDNNDYLKPQGKLNTIPADIGDVSDGGTGFYAQHWAGATTNAQTDPRIGCFYAASQGGNWSDAYAGYNGFCVAVPIALVSRRNQGAFHPQFNPNGAARFLDTDGTTESMWYATDQTVTSLADCYTHASGGAIGDGAGSNGMPGTWYYDSIYASDVKDLRFSANKLELSSESLERIFQHDIAGYRRGWEACPSVLPDGTQSFSKSKAHATLWCDIIGDPAEYPAGWSTDPILGVQHLENDAGDSLIPDGNTAYFQLSRYQEATPNLVLKNGTELVQGSDWSYSTTTRLVNITPAPAATDVIQIFYYAEANPYTSHTNSAVYALGQAHVTNYKSHRLCKDLTGKLATSTTSRTTYKLGELVDYGTATSSQDRLLIDNSSAYLPRHPTQVDLGSTSGPAVKLFPYLSAANDNTARIVLVFKELIYDTSDWGDDQKFVIADGVTTTTDDNANTVKCGQVYAQLPYFINE